MASWAVDAASWLARRAAGVDNDDDDTARAPSQAGVFEGLNPTVWNKADPIVLFIIQATIVITLTRALYWPLAKIREPRVIAEVITVSPSPLDFFSSPRLT